MERQAKELELAKHHSINKETQFKVINFVLSEFHSNGLVHPCTYIINRLRYFENSNCI